MGMQGKMHDDFLAAGGMEKGALSQPLIEVRELSYSFGDKAVLNQVSFLVEKGEIVGLLGPSGAGKTTLVHLLTGQLAAKSGSIRIAGAGREETKAGRGGKKTAANQTAIGIMMDHFGLYERLSVWDNLKIFAKLYQVPVERIDFLLKKAELFSEKKTLVGRLSKGMRSRVNFCRALLKQAEILFLDEPTSGLDPATTAKIHELILEQKNAGATIFLTTHNMHEAGKICDSILLLNEGKIVERGKPGELCRKYNLENKITVILKDGSCQILHSDGGSAKKMAEWMRTGELVSVHSSEPDLEQVFLHLTGKELNV